MQPGKTVAIRQAYLLKVVMILKPIFLSFGDIKLVLILGGRVVFNNKYHCYGHLSRPAVLWTGGCC